MRNKYIRLIVIAYISFNILSVIFYCTIPNENFVQSKSSVASNQFENMQNEIKNNPQLLTLTRFQMITITLKTTILLMKKKI